MTRKYDSTVARIAGNLLSGNRDLFYSNGQEEDSLVRHAVFVARKIVTETQRTEASQEPT